MATALKDKVTVETRNIPVSQIVANSAQSRGMGVCPRLKMAGYGLFEKISLEAEQEPIWQLLFSDSAADRKKAVQLIADYEPSIESLADKLAVTGQLQPIGVLELDDGTFDVIFGMRRTLAMALNIARNPKAEDTEIEAKVFSGKLSQVELKLMALEENDDREAESPIDKAMTYKWLQEEGKMSAEEIGKRTNQSGQNIRLHLKLLDKLLEDKRMQIHTGELAVDRALKLLAKRKGGGKDEEGQAPASEGTRYRMPSIKGLAKIYEAKEKPKKMDKKEWELWCSDDVRKLLAYKLGFRFSPWTPPAEEDEESNGKAKAESNGKASEDGGKKTTVIKIKRKRAVDLLVSLGKTNARTWKDDELAEKLENIPNTAGDAEPETESLKGLLKVLKDKYATGYKVQIMSDK